jgi:hypothetical protein
LSYQFRGNRILTTSISFGPLYCTWHQNGFLRTTTMTTSAKEWLGELSILSQDDFGGNFAGRRHWGFTIYRTGYGPSSDQQWQRLLETIQAGAYEGAFDAIESEEEDPKRDAEFQELWSLFRLDARSDPALAGLDMDQLRQLYNSGEGGQPMNSDFNLHRIFLLADEQVLSDPAASCLYAPPKPMNFPVVKCVDVDYRAEDHIPRDTRVGGQRYFGWMRMKAASVADFWVRLGMREMSELAPPTIGGSHLVVWDGGRM